MLNLRRLPTAFEKRPAFIICGKPSAGRRAQVYPNSGVKSDTPQSFGHPIGGLISVTLAMRSGAFLLAQTFCMVKPMVNGGFNVLRVETLF